MRMLRGMVLGCAAGALLCGCTVGPDYKSPDTPMPDFFTDAVASIKAAISSPAPPAMAQPKNVKGAPATVAPDLWWRSLGDAELNALIDRAVAENLDLAVALARLQEARTQEAVILGISLPSASAEAAVGKGTGSDVTRSRIPSDLTSAVNGAGLKQVNAVAGFDAVWELDIFGQYRREIEAARYDTEAATAARNAVMISVIGDVVRAYVDLRGLQMRLAILRQDVAAETAALGVVQTRYNRGLTNELDVALAQRELASLSSGLAPLVAQIEAAQRHRHPGRAHAPGVCGRARPARADSRPAAEDRTGPAARPAARSPDIQSLNASWPPPRRASGWPPPISSPISG